MNQQTIQSNATLLTQQFMEQGYDLVSIHHYKDQDGHDIYWKLRLRNSETGAKIIRPMSYKDGQFFLGEPDFTGPKPIYNQHLLKDAELVFWVEGEAVADALAKL